MRIQQHGVLHDASDEFNYWLSGKGSGLFSALDVIGTTLKATCVKCGRWQTEVGLLEDDLNKRFAQSGWKLPEEICPKCRVGECLVSNVAKEEEDGRR
jgi:hypothetical protein